jgi:hypothetical protein
MLNGKEKALTELQQNGIALAPTQLDKIADVNNYLRGCPVYNAHVKAKASATMIQYAAVMAAEWPMFCIDMQDAVVAPHLFELMVDYYDFARTYFGGEQPILYSMNAFWTQPVKSGLQYMDTHGWHRDADDRKQLVIFVYGTDVENEFSDGAHLYQIGTHNVPDDKLGRDFRSPPPHVVKTVMGKAGTVFLSDTRGVHIGRRPNKLRMLCWGRWGVSTPPQSYGWDKLKPVDKALLGGRYPSRPEIQDAVRFVVQ